MRIISVKIILMGLIIGISPQVSAELPEKAAKESLELRKIMQNLGKRMQAITDGISREDWVLVKDNSALIADHPTPPFLEKVRILSFVGTDIGKYKDYDEKTHNAALELGVLAAADDAYGVTSAFLTLQNTCLACHLAFREPFIQHFYNSSED